MKFTLLWTVGGLLSAAMLLGLVAPLILWWIAGVDLHSNETARLTVTVAPMFPFVVALVLCLLSLFGRLPGTKAR